MIFKQAVEVIRDHSRREICNIVADYVNLKRSGSSMKGRCPFHDEKTPSFHVSESKEIYKCFGCGAGGDAIDFLMNIEGIEFHEAIFKLAQRFNITIDDKVTNGHQSKLQHEDSIIPGIREIRSSIRKAGKVIISMDQQHSDPSHGLPVISVPSSLSPEQAETLAKYTSECVFSIKVVSWPQLKTSLHNALQSGLSIYILNPTYLSYKEEDWIDYLLPEVGGLISRKEIIQLIASIPDDLVRSIYTTHFSNHFTQK